MPNADQPPPDEITEEVPKAELARPSEKPREEMGPYRKWNGGTLRVEDMTKEQRRAFRKLPKAEQLAYQATIDAENAAATAFMEKELQEHRATHRWVQSERSRLIAQIERETAADERWEQRLRAERKAMEEQQQFLTNALRELSTVMKDVAREEDIDTLPGWALAAFELLPYVSMAYAFFGKELATKRDPKTGEVTGFQLKDLTAAERAVHATIGEMAFSKKITMMIVKMTKKVLARAMRSSVNYVARTAKDALT